MTYDNPDIVYTETRQVACDGGPNPALGHPKVYYTISDSGYVDCGYCDRRFVLRGSPADIGGTKAA